jgi:hypothetical protein
MFGKADPVGCAYAGDPLVIATGAAGLTARIGGLAGGQARAGPTL